MNSEIERFFSEEKIEFYSALDYSSLREINHSLAERAGIVPKSAIIFLIPYYTAPARNLSVYSASKDYHIMIKDITTRLIALFEKLYPGKNFRGFGDHSPIDERHAALISGLGILGDNGLLINEKYGTYVFIADVLTDIPPFELQASPPGEISYCEHCGRCKAACPTGILSGESFECLSAITQKKGDLTEKEISLMKKYNTVWGCDICQSSCPHNSSPLSTPIKFFYEDRLDELTTQILNSFNDEEFKKRAFAWRGKKTVERNLKYLNM